jgi:stage V sporulation protein R
VSNDNEALREYAERIEALAKSLGLEYYPVEFELAPGSLMTEISVYGLPIRMPHWSFGVRYIHQIARQSMGNSKIYEVMFPGDPCKAFLMETNSLPENALVTAHVLGHADFSKNNQLFSRFQSMAGGNIVSHAAVHAQRIHEAIERVGIERVEPILDAALALESHVNVEGDLYRNRYPEFVEKKEVAEPDAFQKRFQHMVTTTPKPIDLNAKPGKERTPIPPHPEFDLLWFIAQYAPEMEQWERDIFMMVRAESLYFYPVFACQIMNEGWASYWHARLLREADFLPQALYLSAIKAHSDVVRPFAAEQQVALQINPYHLGFTMWEKIVGKHGLEKAREIMRDEDDFSFIRNWLDEELVEDSKIFVFKESSNGELKITSKDLDKIKESIIAPKYNYGAPRVAVTDLGTDGTLTLTHDHPSDGRGLDTGRAKRVLEYVKKVWRRQVKLITVDQAGQPIELKL